MDACGSSFFAKRAAALAGVLAARPDLAHVPVPGYRGRTLLHIATDWPGYLPHGPDVVRVLIERGADPNHRGGNGEDGETPLHWAASSDDVDVAGPCSTAVPTPKRPADPSARHSTTPSATAAGTSHRCLPHEGCASTSCGMRPPWAGSTSSKRSWRQAQTKIRSRKRSGTPAPPPNDVPRNVYSRQEQI